jgi:hypothetical protein
VDLRVESGAHSVVWWVNDNRVFADGRGVGGYALARPSHRQSVRLRRALSLAPLEDTTEMTFEVARLLIRRPGADEPAGAGHGSPSASNGTSEDAGSAAVHRHLLEPQLP